MKDNFISLLADLQKLSAEAKGWAIKATSDREALAEERLQVEQQRAAAAAEVEKLREELKTIKDLLGSNTEKK